MKFEAIAGLDDAKGLIQEAVVLPLIIPNYFQGIRYGCRTAPIPTPRLVSEMNG